MIFSVLQICLARYSGDCGARLPHLKERQNWNICLQGLLSYFNNWAVNQYVSDGLSSYFYHINILSSGCRYLCFLCEVLPIINHRRDNACHGSQQKREDFTKKSQKNLFKDFLLIDVPIQNFRFNTYTLNLQNIFSNQ